MDGPYDYASYHIELVSTNIIKGLNSFLAELGLYQFVLSLFV